MPLSAIQVLLRALEEEGVTHIFGIPGGPLVPLYEALAERQHIQPVLAKHEEGAAFMAEGYARVRRGLGVCCGTSGPGATNALTGVASAYSDSIPLLFLSAQVATSAFGKGALQDSSGGNWNLNIVEVFRSATKLSAMLTSAGQMPHLVYRALRTALTGRQGAVHLNLPADVMRQDTGVEKISPKHYRSHVTSAGNATVIDHVAHLLHTATCPALFVGHGVNLAGAWEPLLRLAETLRIPVATTLKGKSAFPEHHPLSLGVFGLGGSPFSDAYLLGDEIDVLLILGTSLGEFQTHGWDQRLVHNRTVIQIDIDPLEIGKNYPVDVSLVGDANDILSALAHRFCCPAYTVQRGPDNLLARVRAEHQRSYTAEVLQGQEKQLKPQAVVARMSEMLPPETLLFVDNGNCLSWAGQFYFSRQPGTVFMATNVASMGYAVAASIGGKIAAPQHPVVALVGDSAFAMNGTEVHTAVEYDIPVIWVVLNNGGHGMVHNGETLLSGRSLSPTVFRHPIDVAMFARSLGVQAYRADTLEQFTRSLRIALDAQAPCVIDAYVSLSEIPYALKMRADTLRTFFGKEERQTATNSAGSYRYSRAQS